jgi:hypothetical protein
MSVIDEVRTKFWQMKPKEFNDPETWLSVLPHLGYNDENPDELPKEVLSQKGLGLRIWQYPNQFAPYLAWLAQEAMSIRSYLEIGTRHGGTFVVHAEILRRLNPRFSRAVAVDIIDRPALLESYEYLQLDSQSDEFAEWIGGQFFDLVFIDGDHEYSGVERDAESTLPRSNIQVFHDITSDECPGVGNLWREYRRKNAKTHRFVEFVEQYDSVEGNFFGLGVAIRRHWLE